MRRADELGAHVSASGGVQRAPARAADLRAAVFQVFTKTPAQWAEPRLAPERVSEFRSEREAHGILCCAAHDSYLINLASPDRALFARSYASFCAELERCDVLGMDYVVTHPGNATDGDAASALERNADAIGRALIESGGDRLEVLLETTAGSGRVLGATFAELAAMIERIPGEVRHRVGICLDTCHVWAAGYDIRSAWDEVVLELEDAVGLDRVRFFHLNDSVTGLGSRLDRHAHIGRGALGDAPFSHLLADARFVDVPKVIETPKEGDATRADRRNLRRLRSLRRMAG